MCVYTHECNIYWQERKKKTKIKRLRQINYLIYLFSLRNVDVTIQLILFYVIFHVNIVIN